jgi:putative hemolysin
LMRIRGRRALKWAADDPENVPERLSHRSLGPTRPSQMPASRSKGSLSLDPLGRPPHAPAFDLVERHYRVRLARDEHEVAKAQRLRYEVFNLELEEGLASSHETGLDEDAFDRQCHHLLLIDERSGRVVGTYRLQTRETARAGVGFYCQQEFRLDDLGDEVLDQSVELGRACIEREHRMGTALFALWRGLAAYLVATGKRYLFGCCSLTSQDPALGRTAEAWLAANDKLHPLHRVGVQPGFECIAAEPDPATVAAFELPQLFGTYLRYGALSCGPAAIDRAFGTIDFLVLFDLSALDPRLRRLFFDTH